MKNVWRNCRERWRAEIETRLNKANLSKFGKSETVNDELFSGESLAAENDRGSTNRAARLHRLFRSGQLEGQQASLDCYRANCFDSKVFDSKPLSDSFAIRGSAKINLFRASIDCAG